MARENGERDLADETYGSGWSARIERRLAEGEKRFTSLERTCRDIANEVGRVGKELRDFCSEQRARSKHPSFSDDDLDLPTGVTHVRALPDKAREWRRERDEAIQNALDATLKHAEAEHRRKMATIKAWTGAALALLGAVGTLLGMLGR